MIATVDILLEKDASLLDRKAARNGVLTPNRV
jgi:hypothetical protein